MRERGVPLRIAGGPCALLPVGTAPFGVRRSAAARAAEPDASERETLY
jgi:putative tricarboxylic transport membrane protein